MTSSFLGKFLCFKKKKKDEEKKGSLQIGLNEPYKPSAFIFDIRYKPDTQTLTHTNTVCPPPQTSSP